MLRLPDGRVWGIAGNIVAWFDGLPEAMGRPELAADPRFADPIIREQNRSELEAELTDWAATFDTFDEFRRTLEGATAFTTAELRSIVELAETDWAEHRQLFFTTESGVPIPARPAVGGDIGTNGRLARRGADNAAVLRDVLDMDDAQIAAHVANGVLVSD